MLQTKLPDAFCRAIRAVLPDFNGDGSKLISDYEVDSFDLMVLRTILEEDLRIRYEDSEWVKIKKFSDYLTLASAIPLEMENFKREGGAQIERHYQINMPQMNISGLSEYWYLKEIGDMHWRTIASSLDVPSDRILDQMGNRLYATFVRIRFSSTHSLQTFKENDPLRISSELSRFGNFFLSMNTVKSGDKKMNAELVTSFVARGSRNSDLLKSVPVEQPKNAMKVYTEVPKLVEEYHLVRKNQIKTFNFSEEVIFEDTYQLDPFHDLNGVGLLYFAAYPHIFDVCERNYMRSREPTQDWAFSASTLSRDIYYLGNADLADEILYRLRSCSETNGVITFVSELIRKSDGKRVSLCIVQKERKK